jgi:glycosyltransferase involved in cell wall biosynthesis
MLLTILMPCLDEAETIGSCIRKAQGFLLRTGTSGEILVADNGSADGSQQIAAALGARVVHVSQRGYGAALRAGIAAARGQFTVMGDADDSYDFAQLDGFLDALRNGADLVVGNRFRGGIMPGAMPALHRYLGNPVLSLVGRTFFRTSISDFHCGLRGFRTEAIRQLDLQSNGMEFASEMIVRSALGGLRLAEVPTKLHKDGRDRPPHLRTWHDGWRHLKFLLMYSPRWLFLIPGATLLILGATLASLLFWGPQRLTSNVVLDLNTFLAACFFVMLGIQLVTFGVLIRHHASVQGFLPDSPRATALVNLMTIDRLALLALVLAVVGAALLIAALLAWQRTGFGPLPDPLIPRLIVLGATMIVIGVQTFFSAFLLGILSIPTSIRFVRTRDESGE